MGRFLTLSVIFAILLGALIMLGGAVSLSFAGIFLVGMLFAALYTSYEKNREDLARIEKKLDQLLEQQKEN